MRSKATLTAVFILAVLAAMIWRAGSVNGQIVEAGLIAHWTLDESDIEGETVKDILGENHGITVNGPVTAEGKIGEALQFDGVDDYVRFEVFVYAFEAFTFEAWAKPVDFPHDLKVMGTGGAMALEIEPAEKKFRWAWRAAEWQPGILSATIAEVDTWYHLAATYDDGTQRLYVNGVEEAKSPAAGLLNIGKINIGSYSPGHPGVFCGLIDEVRVYDRALSEDEIQTNYKSKGLAVSAPVAKLALTWGAVKASK